MTVFSIRTVSIVRGYFSGIFIFNSVYKYIENKKVTHINLIKKKRTFNFQFGIKMCNRFSQYSGYKIRILFFFIITKSIVKIFSISFILILLY